ncbi:MAG: MarR family winged helix-turn-helix transcriptional regulator [Microbacterium gubbeenense]|uniref:MarR family winged helix-turn-helix transcriptional regulator n=1 Tax=Microbacterium gubbeenense TaxID=159896 RepID=UPI003F9C8980
MSRPRSFTPEEQATWAPVATMMELLPRRLDAQLLRDDDLTHFDYFAMAVLTRADGHSLRMSELADRTNATRPRLSHVIGRLETRGYVVRSKAPGDARGTDVRLTHEGRRKAIAATPRHVDNVRDAVLDALTPEQHVQLREIANLVLERLDPSGQVAGRHRGDFDPS